MKISVIIPVFNGAPFVDRAMSNVQSQSRPPDEIIFVDDGSTDGTARAIERYTSARYIYQVNAGPSAARNAGLKDSAGDLIAFIDVDDLWESGKLEREAAILEGDPSVDIGQGLILDVDSSGGSTNPSELRLERLSSPYAWVNLGSMLFRRSIFDRVGGFDVALKENEDTDWYIRAWESGTKKRVVDEVCLYYTIREGSLVTGQDASRSPLPMLMKRHRDRSREGGERSFDVSSAKAFFGVFPDRRQRYPRNDYIDIRLEEFA